MKVLKVFISFIFVLVLFRIDLYSTIYSRIEGVIKDKETGNVIEGAKVYLFIERTQKYETQTDSKGAFVFKKVEPEKDYYVVGEKKGYISNVPKFKRNEIRIYLTKEEFKKYVNGFFLKSGEIKYVIIELERGGSIKGRIMQIDSTGTKPSNDDRVILIKEKEPDDSIPDKAFFNNQRALYYLESDKNGYYEIGGLMPSDKYILQIKRKGFAINYFENIEVKRNDTTVIDFTFDLDSKTGIRGIIRKDGIPIRSAFIHVFRLSDNKRIADFHSRKNNGEYSIMMIEPGSYQIEYSYSDKQKNRYTKEIIVEIEKDVTQTINIDF